MTFLADPPVVEMGSSTNCSSHDLLSGQPLFPANQQNVDSELQKNRSLTAIDRSQRTCQHEVGITKL